MWQDDFRKKCIVYSRDDLVNRLDDLLEKGLTAVKFHDNAAKLMNLTFGIDEFIHKKLD